jgi:hypothetical protein
MQPVLGDLVSNARVQLRLSGAILLEGLIDGWILLSHPLQVDPHLNKHSTDMSPVLHAPEVWRTQSRNDFPSGSGDQTGVNLLALLVIGAGGGSLERLDVARQ